MAFSDREHAVGVGDSLRNTPSVISSSSRSRREAGIAPAPQRRSSGRLRFGELDRRDVDRDPQLARPARRVRRTRVRSTHSPICSIRPASSAIGMNTAGEIGPRTGWSQRISASTPVTQSSASVDDRLIEEVEARPCASASRRSSSSTRRSVARLEQIAGEEAESPAPARLRGIKREIGVADQLLAGRCRRSGATATPTEAPMMQRLPPDRIGLRQAVDDAVREITQPGRDRRGPTG